MVEIRPLKVSSDLLKGRRTQAIQRNSYPVR